MVINLYIETCMASRLDVRFNAERWRWLEETTQDRGVPTFIVIRSLIDAAYEDILREPRRNYLAVLNLLLATVPENDCAEGMNHGTEARLPDGSGASSK